MFCPDSGLLFLASRFLNTTSIFSSSNHSRKGNNPFQYNNKHLREKIPVPPLKTGWRRDLAAINNARNAGVRGDGARVVHAEYPLPQLHNQARSDKGWGCIVPGCLFLRESRRIWQWWWVIKQDVRVVRWKLQELVIGRGNGGVACW